MIIIVLKDLPNAHDVTFSVSAMRIALNTTGDIMVTPS